MRRLRGRCALAATLAWAAVAHADIVADWADVTTAIATDGPNTTHTMALVQSAVYEAVNAITRRYPQTDVPAAPADGASIHAAIAAASHAVLMHEAPALSTNIDAVYEKALAGVPEGAERVRGIALGESAAADVLARHAADLGHPEPYRPVTTPGTYVPTATLLGVAVAQQRPWFFKTADAIRPGPPPSLKSALWARDYNEVKAYGAAESKVRTAEQTDIAKFWATALPDVHMGVVRSVADMPGRDLTRNARLYAAVTAAMNDAEITVFEAKYHYNFWRPITAIRNGDRDDNAATERDPGWGPMISTPLQPEYPCGHCILGWTIATLLQLEAGDGPLPLATHSNTAPGVTRHWTHPREVAEEVSNARIWAGVHYRNSCDVGAQMGERIGKVVAEAYGLRPVH